MARKGQLNLLSAQLKTALEDGIESTGAICGDGSPAYGGTGSGEDFDDFTIYSYDIGDASDEDDIEDIPCITIRGDRVPVEPMHDDNNIYQADFVFEVRIHKFDTKTIDSTAHDDEELMNWYLERLQYVLDQVYLDAVMVAGKFNGAAMNMGRVDDEADIFYLGQTYLTIMFAEEGASQ